eukprot:6476081-Amphidinium_carterae.1
MTVPVQHMALSRHNTLQSYWFTLVASSTWDLVDKLHRFLGFGDLERTSVLSRKDSLLHIVTCHCVFLVVVPCAKGKDWARRLSVKELSRRDPVSEAAVVALLLLPKRSLIASSRLECAA